MGARANGGLSRAGRQSALAEINVTPLVDVMLVLLIISMVAAPMLQRGINLDLPATKTATDIAEARVVISVDRDGHIQLNDRPLHFDLLEERIRGLARSSPEETVFLRADKLLPYGEVLLVMDRIRAGGITRIALVTVPLESASGPR
ncbi:MAG TPA: ExbD/TolR family protein [Candidatus Polarisedimenticolaceae bacterium]|nr:ExbD/TolR family protein [Candidatus Polarisedimenticolaceae bacterium]